MENKYSIKKQTSKTKSQMERTNKKIKMNELPIDFM